MNNVNTAKSILQITNKLYLWYNYGLFTNQIDLAINYFNEAATEFLEQNDYKNAIDCYFEIAHLQSKPVIALTTFEKAVKIALLHDKYHACELCEIIINRHSYLKSDKPLLYFFEVCADVYYEQERYNECSKTLNILCSIYSNTDTLKYKCDKVYQNIIFIYLVKLNLPYIASVSCDTLVLLFSKNPIVSDFYKDLKIAILNKDVDNDTFNVLIKKLKYIPIL